MAFKRAERTRIPLKIAICGPSGSGKTYSALRVAFGLGPKVAVLDTENGSASLYADIGEFDTERMDAPYQVKKFVEAIKQAEAAKYDVLVIDSLSHEWAGEGGLLDQKAAKDAQSGSNSFTNWAQMTKQHEVMKAAILQSPLHIICTMRSKQAYSQEKDERTGKNVVKKLGLEPVQREGIEYEFTVVWDVDMSHNGMTSKDRTGLFTDETTQLTEAHGRKLIEWLTLAVDPQAEVKAKLAGPAIPSQLEALRDLYKVHGITDEDRIGPEVTYGEALVEYRRLKALPLPTMEEAGVS